MEETKPTNSINLDSPLDTNEKKLKIKGSFPQYLSLDKADRLETIQEYEKEIEYLMEDYKEDEQALDYIKKKMIVQMYQNPFFEAVESFQKQYQKYFGGEHKRPKVLKIIKEDQIPDIQFIAKCIADNNLEQLQKPPWIVMCMQNLSSEQFVHLIQDIYNQKKGKVYNLERIFLWFPDFLQAKENTNQKLFFTEGSLNIEYRYYIAIIASAIFDCQYIYNRLVKDFIDMGGDETWIKGGIKNVPEKLKKITRLNTILAFQPQVLLDQQLNLQYFEQIMSGDNLWSKSELITAFSIISYIHFLCGFVICFGINDEIDTFIPIKRKSSQDSIFTEDGEYEKSQEQMEQEKCFFDNMKKISSNIGDNHSDFRLDYKSLEKKDQLQQDPQTSEKEEEQEQQEKQEQGQQQIKEQERKVQQEKQQEQEQEQQQQQQQQQQQSQVNKSDLQVRRESKDLKNKEDTKQNIQDILQKDLEYAQQILKKYPQYLFQELAPQSNQHKTVYLNGNEFNFKQNGVRLIAEHDEELSKVLLEQIQIVKTMTNNVYGDKTLQTLPFRRAIRLYVENLSGFRYEGVDYKDHMNKLLHPDLKKFIRTVIIRPNHITRRDYNDIPLYGLNITELAHIVLIALHAKMEMQLSYCTAALMKTQ